MSEMQSNLGRSLLKSLVSLREQKGQVSLEDVGSIFMQMASTINPAISKADQFMHEEIARLAKYISDAKQEIFSISTNDKSETVIIDASQHLDEVVKETELASNNIMDAADAIQNAAGGIGGDKEKQIMDATNRIYESCNFQDITGQRINKVIKLLSNIDERINKLNSLFGTATNTGDTNGANVVSMSDKDLLNGPQLGSKAATQDEIDQLFASLGGSK